MFLVLETFENMWENIVFATKMFLNLLGNIFASGEANFLPATMFPVVGKLGNIDRKHVSATMYPSLLRALTEATHFHALAYTVLNMLAGADCSKLI